jgi:hypothetical protein
MSTPKYEFERYYAEEDKNRFDRQVWLVMGEDKPGNLQSLGFKYVAESTAHKMADYYNARHETGFESKTQTFINPEKQARWELRQNADAIRKEIEKMERQTRKDMPKSLNDRAAAQPANPGHAGQKEEQASMAYTGWATFGDSSSKNENDQPQQKNIDGRDRWSNA